MVLKLYTKRKSILSCMKGYSAPDWESWGDGGACDGVNAIEVQAGAYNAMHWAAVSEDEADDENLNTFPGTASALSPAYLPIRFV